MAEQYKRGILCLAFFLLLSRSVSDGALNRTCEEFVRLVGDKLVQNTDFFFNWDYGGALVFDGLFQADQTFGTNYQIILNKFLDDYKFTDKTTYGYKILHGIPIPWDNAIGDGIGLFPIVYLNRLRGKSPVIFNNTGDKEIIHTVAESFILKWPMLLPDKTVSRDHGWKGQQDHNASFVWADDQYMGLTLLSRLAPDDMKYAMIAGQEAILFNSHLNDPEDNIIRHGSNVYDGKTHLSCCKWGRANGWGMLSHVEVLQALSPYAAMEASELFEKLLAIFQNHAKALLQHQAPDGRWRQVVNVSSTYPETSSTAMYLSAMARGVTNGWLNRTLFSSAIHSAWNGLNLAVSDDGTVNGVCVGTGIRTSVESYAERPTIYLLSRNGGVGAVLYAAVDYYNFLRFEKKEMHARP